MTKTQLVVSQSRATGLDRDARTEAPGKDARMQEIWARICSRLRAELGEAVYESWFGRLEVDHVSGGVAHLTVPTRFLKSWIQSHYMDRLLVAVAAEMEAVDQISLQVRSNLREASAPSVARPASLEAPQHASPAFLDAPIRQSAPQSSHDPAEAFAGSPLDRRFTFSNFIVGRSNQLAHAAAERVAGAAAKSQPIYNPLYLHAAVGLGKTHLLQAVAHATVAAGRRVIYLTAEKFMYGFVSALKAQTAIAFKEKLRAIDVLIIDDIQFLQGKSIQQEFCHTLNALIDARKQVVIAADRPPSDLETLDERVRSRLAGGLSVEVEALDEELRRRILGVRIEAAQLIHPGFTVSDAVLNYVAHAIETNGRDLDGAVNRLLAHSTLSGASLSVEMAESAIRDLVRTREPKRVKIEDIQKLVGTHYSVSRSDILSSRRTANVVRPRQIAMYLAKILTPRSLPEIGRRFGGRDHTTVLHAVRKIEALSSNDRALQDEIELLKRMLQE